jgi:PAS domain S-box-containing protein
MTTPWFRRPTGPAVNRLDRLDRVLYARWVRAGTALTAVGYGLVTVVGLLLHGGLWYGFYSQVPTVVCAALAWLIARRGHPDVAALIALGAVWVELHSDLPLVGVRGSGLIAFPLVVMAMGFLRGRRGAYALAAVTSLTIPATTLAGFWIRGAPIPEPAETAYLVVICVASMFAAAALVGLGLDSFDRVLAKATASEERISALIRHAPVGILAADSDGYIASVTPTAEALLGARAARLAGKRLDSVLVGAFPDADDRSRIDTLLEENEATVPLRLDSPEGDVIEIEALSMPLPWADGSVGTQIILRDVTARRRAEENERLLQAQLEHTQRLEAVGRLAGGVAHDFNNLLTVVGASSEMLLDETEGHARELARDILDAKVRGVALTQQLLAFARKDPIQVRRLSLSRVVRDHVALLRRFLTEDVDLVVDADRETPEVMADPAHVEQILANLVINARDAVRAGGHVSVAVYPPGSPRSWAGGNEWVVDEGFVELSVEDDGTGMCPDVREHIFEPFFTTKPRERGTGLGLASVHGIMNQNGGKVRVLSEPGVGTCLVLSWPVAGRA